MSSSKKKKETIRDYEPKKGFEMVTLELEDDLYFSLLEICIRERKTLDDLVNEILKDYIEKHKHLLKKPSKKAKKTIKKACPICGNSGFVVDRKTTFGTPGYIETKKKCPLDCKRHKS